jgi:hydrogenase-1 operon protein HyaE
MSAGTISNVFDSLRTTAGCEAISAASVDSFIAAGGPAILFLTGDTLLRAEATDVAVVVRELMRSPAGRGIRLGIVDRRDEPAMMQKFGVVVVPALVLLQGGAVQEIIARIRDWPVYTQAFARLRAAAPMAATA